MPGSSGGQRYGGNPDHMLHSAHSEGTAVWTSTFVGRKRASDPLMRYNWPPAGTFDAADIQHNLALTYGHRMTDGIGSQLLRMIVIYAVSNITGIGHLFQPLGCVGHIGHQVGVVTEVDGVLHVGCWQRVLLAKGLAKGFVGKHCTALPPFICAIYVVL